jgi:hypothetical protein
VNIKLQTCKQRLKHLEAQVKVTNGYRCYIQEVVQGKYQIPKYIDYAIDYQKGIKYFSGLALGGSGLIKAGLL